MGELGGREGFYQIYSTVFAQGSACCCSAAWLEKRERALVDLGKKWVCRAMERPWG